MLSHRIGNKSPALVILLVVSLLGQPGSKISAQNSRAAIVVSGTVRNSAGEPVAGATVILEDAERATQAAAKTRDDGMFKLSVNRPGKYTVRTEKAGWSGDVSEPFALAAGGKKRIDLVMETSGTAEAASPGVTAATAVEFKDEPDFTVAGVTDWSNAGLHGSDTTSRTSEALARETLTLKAGDAKKTPGEASNSKYGLASESEVKGDFAQAREQVRSLLATSDDAEGHHLLADLEERLGDPLEAVREYERAARMAPSEQNYFDWGSELLLHKAAQPAVEVFTKGSGFHPDSARMLAGLGAALYGVGSYDDAARRLCAASDLRPDDPAPYLFLGQMERTVAAPLPCAEERLARFVHVQPANAQANYYYAVSLCKGQRGTDGSTMSRQAEALLEKAVTLDPNFGEAYVQLGILYFARNDFAQAVQVFQRAIKVSPQLSEAHYRLSLAYKRAGDEEKAHQEFDAYKKAQKTETAVVERQRSELKQFLVILKNPPEPTRPH